MYFEDVTAENLCDLISGALSDPAEYSVEHLRALCPETRVIWCSDLDFSLHAFRLRVDYFLLEPVTEEAFRQGLCVWLEGK